MPTFKDSISFQTFLEAQRTQNTSIGFVPTMGALHQGHLSLVEHSIKENQLTVVSIFVNPTQFGDAGDLENYPRTLSKDEALLYKLHPNLVIFAPTANDLYSGTVVSKSFNFGALALVMEGQYRKGHFDGVGTVLELFFDLVKPQYAYFGQKDFQQLQIVKKLVSITKQPVIIVGCPIYREANGLAMSSRNERLTPQQREDAAFIQVVLQHVKHKFKTLTTAQLKHWVAKEFKQNNAITLEYFEIANAISLKPINRKRKGNTYRACIAAFMGNIRLIDNVSLNY